VVFYGSALGWIGGQQGIERRILLSTGAATGLGKFFKHDKPLRLAEAKNGCCKKQRTKYNLFHPLKF
jgi:hypothetical protein